jgi:hypothetical protein
MDCHRTSATQVPLFCSGLVSHSAYFMRTAAREGGPSVRLDQSDGSLRPLAAYRRKGLR